MDIKDFAGAPNIESRQQIVAIVFIVFIKINKYLRPLNHLSVVEEKEPIHEVWNMPLYNRNKYFMISWYLRVDEPEVDQLGKDEET